jgi:hypothetical protein
MKIDDIQRLRPDPITLDPDWSAITVHSIVATSRPRPRRRLAIASAALFIGLGGGVAYAGNGVPGWVQSRVDAFSGDQGHGDVDLVRIVDVTTPDGNRVVAWRGTSEDGLVCELLGDNFTEPDKPLVQTYHCRQPDDESLVAAWTTASRPFSVEGEQDPATTFPYVYGQLEGAARVVVSGREFRREAVVDGKTGGYAVPLPEGDRSTDVTVTFFDQGGTVIRRVTLDLR